MKGLKTVFIYLPLCGIHTALGSLLGPSYPSPREISGHSSHVASAWKNVTTTLNHTLRGSGKSKVDATVLQNTTFSMGLFSLHDQDAQSLQYHHTSPSNLNGTVGTKKADANSIYRIASISKLITAYVGMIKLDEKSWNTPLATIFTSLKESIEHGPSKVDVVKDSQWDRVTLSDLAAHIGGVPRQNMPLRLDLLFYAQSNPAILDGWGLPPANQSKITEQYPCVENTSNWDIANCSYEQYAKGMSPSMPRYLPGASPLYSNGGYFLLGGAISNLTGSSLDDLYNETIFNPLGLQDTLSNPPSDPAVIKHTVIPQGLEQDLSDVPLTKSSGGLYSTVNDMAKIGISILNSTLLTPDQTNRWLKPVTFTGNLNYAVGRPWEIYRYVHPDTDIVTDIYTKQGDSGNYCSLLAIVPDFGFGFTIFGASRSGVHTQAVQLVADTITESIMPALMVQAQHEALKNLAGTYVPKNKNLNTTLTLTVPKSSTAQPGLIVSNWISNGSDVKNALSESFINLYPRLPKLQANPNFLRLVPTIQDVANSGQIAFLMQTVNPTGPVKGHLFSRMYDVNDWASTIDQTTYEDTPVDELVFHVDKKTGKATSVTPVAYHVTLHRKN